MSSHIRVRPTALVIRDSHILLVEYRDEEGVHYNLPGGGAEPGETIVEGALRELLEETMLEADVGPIAFVYDFAPHKQSGDYESETHTVNIIFECYPQEGSTPRLPDQPDPNQSAVKWIHIAEFDSIILYPNIKDHIREYIENRRNIKIIEDYKLESYS
jgi:8-oxo-dGTP diphosphatase